MKLVIDAFKTVLREDALHSAVVGFDSTGTTKVYEPDIPKEVTPPYTVTQLVPGAPPAGTYGDLHSTMNFSIMVTGWGRTKPEAWQLWDSAFEALDIYPKDNWNQLLLPWYLMSISHSGDVRALPDRETSLYQVHGTYDIAIGRR